MERLEGPAACARSIPRPSRCSAAATPRCPRASGWRARKARFASGCRIGRRTRSSASSTATIPSYWLRTDLDAIVEHAQARPRRRSRAARRSSPTSPPTPFAASPRSRCSRRTTRGCSPWWPAPAPAPAPISSMPRSPPRVTAWRSTPSHLEREFDHDEDEERRARAHRGHDREAAQGRGAARRRGRRQEAAEGAASRLHRRAASGDRQHAVGSAHRHRDQRAATVPACSMT